MSEKKLLREKKPREKCLDQDAQQEEEVEVCADLLDLARIVSERQTGCITYKHTNLPVRYDHIPECTVGRRRDSAIAAIRFCSRHISLPQCAIPQASLDRRTSSSSSHKVTAPVTFSSRLLRPRGCDCRLLCAEQNTVSFEVAESRRQMHDTPELNKQDYGFVVSN